MSESENKYGKIAWIDLTVPDADRVRDFYSRVIGWAPSPVPMGDYSDYSMTVPGEEHPTCGICYARGENEDLPPQWLIYIIVEDLEKSMEACEKNGGKILAGPKKIGEEQFCVIEDPSGAVAALYEKK